LKCGGWVGNNYALPFKLFPLRREELKWGSWVGNMYAFPFKVFSPATIQWNCRVCSKF
jgi:hypothetical protein